MRMNSLKPEKLSVLVLDDHAYIRDIIRSHLQNMGFKDIEVAATALEAEKMIVSKRYDIVFVDWVLPGQSGYAMMKKFREDRAFDSVAFVMVTGHAEAHNMIEAMKAGATSYIIKPLIGADFAAIVITVIEWINKFRSSQAKS